uniref:Platelet-derived growth factor beta polypeptide a n=1 Tax=Amphiprion percula TaxID=161767 RepID=A0A3P8SKG5_AMPPE
SLVDLVRNSPISSVDDLKLLLQQETNATDIRSCLSLPTVEAQPAQQAACKVRIEVMEITRSMLDRRNANFLLWPPCVEVQRCSGCCNTRLLQCVPTVTSSRYLQVIKIQYINRKAHYDKAIISVEDHLPQSSSTSTAAASPLLPPPLPRPVHPAPPKTHTSKADLHRHDDLKHNQQHFHPEEREPVARQWQQGSYTQLVHWTQPRVHQAPTQVQAGAHQTITGMLGSRQQQLLQHQQRQQYQQQYQYHHQPHYPQQYSHGGAEDQELRTQYRLNAAQSDSASPPVSPTQPSTLAEIPTPLPTAQRDSVTGRKNTEVTHHKQTETATASQKEGNVREESGSANSGDSAGAEPANQGKEKDSKVTSEDGRFTEEERRQKLLEMVQREPEKPTLLHPHHPQQRLKPTGAVRLCENVCVMRGDLKVDTS